MGVWKSPPSHPKSRVQGAQPPPGVTACPPVLENVGGWAGGTTAQAKPIPPLKEGARHSKTLRGRLGPEPMPLRDELFGAAKARLGFAIARDGSLRGPEASVTKCHQPSPSRHSCHIEVLWTTARARAAIALGAPTGSRLLCGQTPSTVPGAAGWPPTERPMSCVTPTERSAVGSGA